MSRQHPTAALCILLLFCLGLGFLLLDQRRNTSVAQTTTPQSGEQDPVALIKTIVIRGADSEKAFSPDVTVAHAGMSSGAETGMMLYLGDELTTSADVKVTILFLDRAAEKDNEVLVDSNTHVQIGSLFAWAGRILARVKDKFEVKTTRAQWGVVGTEYELFVDNDGTNRLIVLKGSVRVDTGNFLPTAENRRRAVSVDMAPIFLRAAFREPELMARQNTMGFVAVSGKVTNVERDFLLTNSCAQRHVYKVSSPSNLPWFQFLGAEQFAIDGKGSRTIKFAIRMDATGIPAGTQESNIVFPCVDCSAEPGCHIGGLLLPITMTVLGSDSPTPVDINQPTPQIQTPTPLLPQSDVAARMQEIVLPPAGSLVKSDASVGRVDQALTWSNPVILAGEPTYSAQSVIPTFSSAPERNVAFREARRSSIVNDDSRSKKLLADVYIDWGNGAKADEELKRLGVSPQSTPETLTTAGEAYRLMGHLDTAEQLLNRAVALAPNSVAAINALGNIYLDRAKAEQDKKNYDLAREYLAKANAAYARTAQTKTDGEQNHAGVQQKAAPYSNKIESVVQSNIGEVHLRLGQLAKDESNNNEALKQFQVAEQAFGNSARADQQYQFAYTGLGDSYRETGETFLSRGETTEANQYFAKSKDHYVQAARLHSDMAEAYVGLGRVFDDTGQHSEALKYYFQATRVRPELPEPHYYLAVALAPIDSSKAAEQARAFLKIEREPLKQGVKGEIARQVIAHRPVPTQTVTPITTTTPPREDLPTPTPEQSTIPQPPQTVRTVQVPGLKDKKPDEAIRELKKRGLEGLIQEKGDCKATGKTLYTTPDKNQTVAIGSTVTVYISTAGPDGVRVPDLRHGPGADAEEELRRLHLLATFTRPTATDAEPEGNVYRQKPDPNKLLMPGCPVELTLAKPIPPVTVGNYYAMTERDASLTLITQGLSVGTISTTENCDLDRRVVTQSPAAGESVRRGTPVNLVIATCDLVDVPDLTGKSYDEALKVVQPLGLGIEVMGGDAKYGVSSQKPTAGPRKARRGTRIQVWFQIGD